MCHFVVKSFQVKEGFYSGIGETHCRGEEIATRSSMAGLFKTRKMALSNTAKYWSRLRDAPTHGLDRFTC